MTMATKTSGQMIREVINKPIERKHLSHVQLEQEVGLQTVIDVYNR